MKHVVLLGLLCLGWSTSTVRAGSIITLADNPEQTGKLTLTPTTIGIGNLSPPLEVNLSDILMADFSDTPFQLNFSYSSADKGGQLPPTWQGQDIGTVEMPGSVTDDNGTFTINGSGKSGKPGNPKGLDSGYFVGRQWVGNGEWTARLDKIHKGAWETSAGMVLRDTLDPSAMIFRLGAGTAGNGGYAFRAEVGSSVQGMAIPMDLPIWMRLTRFASSVFASISTDGKNWDTIGENSFKNMSSSPWIGLYVDSRRDKSMGTALFDQISFTPGPSSAEVLPPACCCKADHSWPVHSNISIPTPPIPIPWASSSGMEM